MKTTSKKVLALFLTLLMVVSCVPLSTGMLTASAAKATYTVYGTSSYPELMSMSVTNADTSDRGNGTFFETQHPFEYPTRKHGMSALYMISERLLRQLLQLMA